MAEGDKIITLPDDDDRVTPRTQDQRGNTQRMTDAGKLEADVEKALKTADDTGGGSPPSDDNVDGDSQESIAELRAKLRRETQRREAAEARASEATEQIGATLDAKAQSDLNTLKTAKAHLGEQQEELKRRLSAAHADGDFDAVADINHKMAQAAVQASSIDNGIIALENAPKQREALRRRGEPGDARFSQITKGMDPAAKQWFRDNPEYYQDDRKLQRVVAAHNMVMTGDDPPEVNSDDYFRAVESELRDPKFNAAAQRGNSGGDDDPDDSALSGASGGERRSSAPPAAAPVTRNGRGAGGSPQNGRQIRLTKEEQEIAEATGQTYEEYARNKRGLEREGRVGPNASNRNRMH